MPLSTTKEHLVQLLEDHDNKVIALSGKWGTGKSHLWREVQSASNDKKIQQALYVSLFGLSDMGQIKLKIVQSALPEAEARSATWDRVLDAVQAAKRVLTALHKGFTALDELALLALPSILKDRVIVLDDIERKHEKLSTDEVLGFIDEFTQQHGARFVLVLNSDQLAEREVWDTLREKVVDQEIRLDTSPGEAFDIAVDLTPSPHADRIRKAVEICGVTNIRIVRKIIKAANRILGERNLSEAVLARVIPSTVVLAAINYKGIENGPDFEFVLSMGGPDAWKQLLARDKELDEKDQREAKWRLLLNELGIRTCDEYEVLVVEFLRSGLFDVGAVSAVVNRYVAETDAMQARERASQFLESAFWDHSRTEAELLAEVKGLLPQAHLLDAYSLTALVKEVSSLPEGSPVADAMVDQWIKAFREKNLGDFDDDYPFRRSVDPRIQAEFTKLRNTAQAKITVFEVCKSIVKNSGWGPMQEAVMKSASVAEFEMTIKSLSVSELKLFMLKMLDLCIHQKSYLTHFGSAMDCFMQACRNIARDPRSGRLGHLIRNLFEDSNLAHQLKPDAA